MRILGLVLIGIGVVMMIFTGFNLITKKNVAKIGPLEINKDEKTPVNWSPIVGVVLIVAGIAVTVTSSKRNSV